MSFRAVGESFKIATVALILCAFAPATLAQWYAGGGLGTSQNRYKADSLASDLASGGITGTGSTGGSPVSGKIFAGYQVYDVFALEVGYFNLGEYLNVNGTYTKPAPASTFSGKSDGQGVDFNLVWTVPLVKSVSIVGRIGGALFRSDPTWNANSPAFATMSGAARKNGVVGTGGLGAQYDFTKTIAARLEWQRYFVPVGLTSGSTSVDLYTAGVVVKFLFTQHGVVAT